MLDWLKTLCLDPLDASKTTEAMCEPLVVQLAGADWTMATNAKAMLLVSGAINGVKAADEVTANRVAGVFKPRGQAHAADLQALKSWLGLYTSPVQCPKCQGSPEKVCPKCAGSKTENCGECHGSGRTECPHCEQDMDCEDCTNGKTECSGCDGAGKVYCEVCDARGLLTQEAVPGDLFGVTLDKHLLARYLDKLPGVMVAVHAADGIAFIEGSGWWLVVCALNAVGKVDVFKPEVACAV